VRRSVREAIVGFSLLAAVSSAVGLSLWLRGLSLTRQYWSVQARFPQADGLAVRSPVVFRGVMVGTVRSVQITPEAVVAQLEITNPSLRLALPAAAQIGQVSLLGGESQVALVSGGRPLPGSAPDPRSRSCDRQRMLCDGSTISGREGASLTNLTNLMYRMLEEVERESLVDKLATVATGIDKTAREATVFLQEGRGLVKDGKGLVQGGKGLVQGGIGMVEAIESSVQKAQPTISNLNASSAHLRQLMAALDNPKVVSDLQRTVANAERLTAQWEAVGGDVHRLTGDPAFMDGMRSVAVGLGQFFDELYPAQTGAARDKAAREAGRGQGPE
jgi:phospholipid/cholesterol/gamma-HCH transport system substrate-binding protein